MIKQKNDRPEDIQRENALDRYFDEISRRQPLSEHEETQLLEQVAQGSQQARDKLITGNLRLVISIAKKRQQPGTSLDDLINEGNIGLIKAVETYRQGSFTAYATKHIRRAIEKAISELTQQTTPPHRDISVDKPLRSNERLTMLDVMPNETAPHADDAVEQRLLTDQIEDCLECLNSRERQVICAIYGIRQSHMTLAEVANQMGIKRERARQIRDKALRAMRKART